MHSTLPEGNPVVTRELLTADYLLDFLKQNLPSVPSAKAQSAAEEEEMTDEEFEELFDDEEEDTAEEEEETDSEES